MNVILVDLSKKWTLLFNYEMSFKIILKSKQNFKKQAHILILNIKRHTRVSNINLMTHCKINLLNVGSVILPYKFHNMHTTVRKLDSYN